MFEYQIPIYFIKSSYKFAGRNNHAEIAEQ